jgi:hypothetical protein
MARKSVHDVVALITYQVWAEAAGERPMSKRALGTRLEEKGYKPARDTKGARAWDGLFLVVKEYAE